MADWSGDTMHLISESGFHLAIGSDGEVSGTPDPTPESQLEISSGGDVSLVRIRGLTSGLYLAFDCDGNLYGETDPSVAATLFEQHFQGSYFGFKSHCFPDWYVGIKKSGKAKNGNRTEWGQKAVKFLPRRRDFS